MTYLKRILRSQCKTVCNAPKQNQFHHSFRFFHEQFQVLILITRKFNDRP